MKYSRSLPSTAVSTFPSVMTQLRADVVFGSPKRKCAGSGICRMLARTGPPHSFSTPCPHYAAILRVVRPDRLLLELVLDQIPREHFALLFGNTHFGVEATFRLPLSITRALFGHRVEIPAGNYPFTIQGRQLFIDLPVIASRSRPFGQA